MAKAGDSSEVEGLHDECFDFVCSVCKKKNKNTEAEKFCTDCQYYYCKQCVTFHDDVPILSTHQILDRAQFKTGLSVKFPEVPTERCTTHGHKPVDMLCIQHDAVGCAICMVTNHSACGKVYIPDHVKINFNTDNASEVMKKLQNIARSLQDLERDSVKEKDATTNTGKQLLKKIRMLREQINQRLDELEQNTLKELDSQLQALTYKIEDEIQELNATIRKVKQAQDSMNSAEGNVSQQFVTMKMANFVANNAEALVNKKTVKQIAVDIDFTSDQKLMSLLNEMVDLGTILDKQATQPQGINSLLKLKGKTSIKMKSDVKTCDIVSACVLDNGTIVIVDCNNCKLKSLDGSTFNVKNSCAVSDDMWQVCAISNQEVAVACGSAKMIQFVSVRDSTMQKTRNINTTFYCLGLAHAGSKLYVSSKSSVYVCTLLGEILQKFAYGHGQLAVNSVISRIYIADFSYGLMILSLDGDLVGKIKPHDLDGAYSVWPLKNGSVLVSGYYSKNILQFSDNGQVIGEVLKTNRNCEAICLNQNNSQLLIGYENENEMDTHNVY